MFLKKYLKYGFIFLLSIVIIGSSYKPLYAQKISKNKNSKLANEPHSAHKATIYSLALPGLGQAYNKKYWKIPVIYAGFGVMIYFISNNRSEYKKFSAAYDYSLLGDITITPPNEYAVKYASSQLKSARDLYRRNLDYSYIITGLWYLLNVVDATVDAHLFEFEVSEDLTLKIEPDIRMLPQEDQPYTGIRVSFTIPFSKH